MRIRHLAMAIAAASISTAGFLAAPAHATTATGKRALLVGELGYEGGAYPPAFHPTAGTVELEFTNPPIVLIKQVGRSGHFQFRLAPGTYGVIGCGPTSSSGAVPLCSRPQTITLAAGQVDFIQLVWAYVP